MVWTGVQQATCRGASWIVHKILGPRKAEFPSPEHVREEVVERARKVVAARRAILSDLAASGDYPVGHVPTLAEVPAASMGIGLSGGGIRSATISLGVAQAFAEKGRLLDFDYCSTVSGGGYFGSFLGSLFLPDAARGPSLSSTSLPAAAKAELLAKARFAQRALTSKAREDELPRPVQVTSSRYPNVRNPIWWLREHSRFLAPNGTSDYAIGAAYMVRNRFAIIYVFSLPLLLLSLGLIALSGWFAGRGQTSFPPLDLFLTKGADIIPHVISPILPVVLAVLLLTISTGFAFWMTGFMSEATPVSKGIQRFLFKKEILGSRIRLLITLLFAVAVLFGVARFAVAMLAPSQDGGALANCPALFGNCIDKPDLIVGATLFGLIVAGVAIAAAAITGLVALVGRDRHDDAFTADVRRRLTRVTSWGLIATLLLLFVFVVDTAALEIYARLVTLKSDAAVGGISILSALFMPMAAWLINKIPGWFGEKNNWLMRLIGRNIWTVALIAGIVMVVSLVVTLHVGAQLLIFNGEPWLSSGLFGTSHSNNFYLLFWLTVALTLLTGCATNFINLSSLHGIYASRLTRAYIGGTNIKRLGESANPSGNTSIKETHPQDQIAIDIYQQVRTAAPIHLVNVTLNETRSREKSQLLERDRKGVPVVFAPEGVFIDAGKKVTYQQYYDWPAIAAAGVERLSVGQLCAISGAAASSAMGSRTTLGGALALTLANIRLGYWWNVDGLIRSRAPVGWSAWDVVVRIWDIVWPFVNRPLRTYFYLLNEARASYSRQYSRLNISDGGHFENSGAYELLRRHVRTILVCDNGADPHYAFVDLENLVRKSRIDLGLTLSICQPEEVVELVGDQGATLFLNGACGDWRARAAHRSANMLCAAPEDTAYCLLLRVEAVDEVTGETFLDGHIVWMKPRLFAGLPQDVAGYASGCPTFPNETTGDQFFDEAQWESYRSLGYSMAWRLLSEGRDKEDILRKLYHVLPKRR